MNTAAGVEIAVVFVWSGMLVGISFIETPLKFRAPGVTVTIGLGIGRLVFRALNTAEVALALVLVAAGLAERPESAALTSGLVALAALVLQLGGVRPRLSRRSDLVLAGGDVARSHAHYVYVGFELVKLAALLTTGAVLLAH